MRVFLQTTLVGVILGLAIGFVFGKVRSAQKPWNPSLEINPGISLSELLNENDGAVEASATQVAADAPEEKVRTSQDRLPVVEADAYSYDFGILEKNPSSEKGEHTFVLKNVGESDLVLAKGSSTCFCTDFSLSKTTVKPGDKAELVVKWDAARSGGVFGQGVTVRTNDPTKKEIYFGINGLYTAPIISDPSRIAFGSLNPSATSARTFRVLGFEKNDDGEPFDLQIESIELSDPEHFEVEIAKGDLSELTEADRKDKLLYQTTNLFNATIILKPGLRQGPFQELLRLRVNSTKTPIFEIPLEGQIMTSSITVSGPLMNKGEGIVKLDDVQRKLGKSTVVRLFISSSMRADAETIKIKSVRPNWLKTALTYPPEDLQKSSPVRIVEMEIAVPPDSPLGAFKGPNKSQMGEVVVEVGDDPDNLQEVVVPVRFAVGE